MSDSVFQTIANETVESLLAISSLQSALPIKCEARLWTAVATGEKTLVVSARPYWKSPIDFASLRQIAGRTATAFVWQVIGTDDRPTEVAESLFETLLPAIESVRAYRYSDVWC